MSAKKTSDIQQALIDAAHRVRENAHSRYSGYQVGAAIMDENGEIHIGCNVENAAYPEGSCAETNAIGAMIAAGGRTIRTIAVVGGRQAPENCTPCGGCRQRIREFADADTVILLSGEHGEVARYDIDTLLPKSFALP